MPKSQSGYSITIRGFIPVKAGDLAQHEKVLAAIREAKDAATDAYEVDAYKPDEGPSADPMLALLEVEKFEVTPVARRTKPEEKAGA